MSDMPSPPQVPFVPPTAPGAFQPQPRRSSWPTVIGVIAIVFGVGGMLMGCWTSVFPLFTDFFAEFFEKNMPAGQPNPLEFAGQFETWSVIHGVAMLIVAAILLVAGIGLVRRRSSSIDTCRLWSVLKILLTIEACFFTAATQRVQFEAMQSQAPGTMPFGDDFTSMIIAATVVWALVWGCALPVFMLIWFARGKIKAETAQWSQSA